MQNFLYNLDKCLERKYKHDFFFFKTLILSNILFKILSRYILAVEMQ